LPLSLSESSQDVLQIRPLLPASTPF
jgi:hypothetical protein